MILQYAIGQIIGDRDTQEDFCAIQLESGGTVEPEDNKCRSGWSPTEINAVLCDGMGGHNAGELAAQTAAFAFLESARDNLAHRMAESEALLAACQIANKAIARKVSANSSLAGMGTTIVGLRCTGRHLSWVSVGDSHLLLLRNKHLIKLNQDHSMRPVIEQMVSMGIISEQDAERHPERNALRSALTGDEIAMIDAGVEKMALKREDIILIASDGIDVLQHKAIQRTLSAGYRRLAKRTTSILSAAERLGGSGQDNTSVVLIRVL